MYYNMSALYCTTCKETFKNKRCLNTHLKSEKHLHRIEYKDSLYRCDCGKTYKFSQGLHVHKKKCTYVPEPSNSTVINQQKEIDELRNQISNLQRQIETTPIPITTTNTNSNNTTNHNNITIQINPFGQEDIARIAPEYFLYCLNKVSSSSPALAEKIYSYPENQNVRIPNKNKPYVSIQNHKGESELKFLDEVLDQMECFCYTLLEEKFTDPEYRRKMSNMKREAFEKYIVAYENDDKGTIRKKIRSSLKLMLFNMTDKQK